MEIEFENSRGETERRKIVNVMLHDDVIYYIVPRDVGMYDTEAPLQFVDATRCRIAL